MSPDQWHLRNPYGRRKKRKLDAYPPEWPATAERIKAAAGWRCERCQHANDLPSGHVLTVHHLDGHKHNLADWNLAALCQRCHLKIQGRVKMDQMFFAEVLDVSEWFKPHLKGYLASLSKLPQAAGECRNSRESGQVAPPPETQLPSPGLVDVSAAGGGSETVCPHCGGDVIITWTRGWAADGTHLLGHCCDNRHGGCGRHFDSQITPTSAPVANGAETCHCLPVTRCDASD